jgi:hypothetical protein
MSGKARLHKLPPVRVPPRPAPATAPRWTPRPPRPTLARAWKPWVHPQDRGYFRLPAGKPLADTLKRFGITTEMASLKDGGGMDGTLFWAPLDAQEIVEVLSILNRALKVSYDAAATALIGLRTFPEWDDIASELRACSRLGADTATLRAIIEQLTSKGDP